MNILVTGDSFATINVDYKHWAYNWAKEHDFNTTHRSYPGQSHVKIVETLRNSNISNFDVIFYCLTDFLRTSITDQDYKVPSKEAAFHLSDYLNGYYREVAFLNYIISNDRDTPADGFVGNFTSEGISVTKGAIDCYYGTNNAMPIQDEKVKLEMEKAGLLYSSISIRWLIKANWYALDSFAKYVTYKLNKPIIFIAPPLTEWQHWDQSHLPEEGYLFNSAKYFHMGPDIGTNHLGIDDASEMQHHFETWCQKNNYIKTIFNN